MAAHMKGHVVKSLSRKPFCRRVIRMSFATSPSDNKIKADKCAKCLPRVFSGIQPTGIPHIGNYVGAIKNWVQLQRKYDDIIFSIVDLHSITVPQDPTQLRQNILDMTACLLACGIDADKSILFQQSGVMQHSELSWILSCLCTIPRLSSLAHWREKSKGMSDPSVGLFTYPILQTADIILYRANAVPVGEDQQQHIELARDLVRSFNRNFSVVFPIPDAIIGDVPKIRSLRNPATKMSKSEASSRSRIELTDTPDQIREKIKKAVTDSTSAVTYDPENRPGVSNLISIHSSLTGLSTDEICEESILLETGEYKTKVTDVVVEHLSPIRERIVELKGDNSYLEKVLRSGQERACEIADRTMADVKKAVGFL